MSYPNKRGPKRRVKIPYKLRGKVNKKVKNATAVEYEGIKFKSKLEMYFYKYSKEQGIEFEYEKLKTILFVGDKLECYVYLPDKSKNISLDTSKLRDITYTPDFHTYLKNGCNETCLVVVECKGKENDAFPLKKKMFLTIMNHKWGQNFYFFEPHNQSQIRQCLEIIKKEFIWD